MKCRTEANEFNGSKIESAAVAKRCVPWEILRSGLQLHQPITRWIDINPGFASPPSGFGLALFSLSTRIRRPPCGPFLQWDFCFLSHGRCYSFSSPRWFGFPGTMNNLSPAGELKRPVRRFNDPPVKLACLSWYASSSTMAPIVANYMRHSRALRIRCDGQPECANCIAKGRSCCYVPSRRGGPRHHPARKQKGPVAQSAIDLTAGEGKSPPRRKSPSPMETDGPSRSEAEGWSWNDRYRPLEYVLIERTRF